MITLTVINDTETIKFITKDIQDVFIKKLLIKSCESFYNHVKNNSLSGKSAYLKGRNMVVEYVSKDTINDISLNHYCKCLKYIQKINRNSAAITGARKFLALFYKDVIESNINFNNIQDLRRDEDLITWNLGNINYEKLINVLEEIELIQDLEIKNIVKKYIKSIDINTYKENTNEESMRLYILGIKPILILLRSVKISDISWEHYCEIMNYIHNQKAKLLKLGMRKIIFNIYNLILENCNYKTKGIDDLRKNRQFIHWKEEAEDESDNEFIKQHIRTSYPIGSNIQDLYKYDCRKESDEDSRHIVLNLNTSREFLRYILEAYIKKQDYLKKRIIIKERLFFYCFESSFANNVPYNIEDITIETYRRQYLFYWKLDNMTCNEEIDDISNVIKRNYQTGLTSILRGFYIFLLTFIKENNIKYNLFIGTNITEYIFTSTRFNIFLREGYEFIKLSASDILVPRFMKWAIIPDGIGSQTASENIIGIDFSKLKNPIYINDLQNYYWKGNRNNVRTTVFKDNCYIMDFLNYKYEFDKKVVSIFYSNELELEFSGKILNSYVSYIKMKYTKKETRKTAFGAVKTYLKYLIKVKDVYGNYKYSVDQLGMEELKEKMDKDRGGNPIPIDVLNLILDELERRRDNSDEDELIYTVIYILINSKLRIGEILNLERNCIGNNETEVIKYVSKTSYGELIEDYFTTEVIEMISQAKKITNKYISSADKRLQKYIFIIPDKRSKILRIKRLSGGVNTKIKKIINKLIELGKIDEKIKEDILKHSCYDIRATRINSLYEKGIEEGLPPLEISSMAGNTINVGMSNYIKKMDKMKIVEIFAGVKIANVNIKGEIFENDDDFEDKVKYKDDFGGCNNIKCREKVIKDDYSFSCLICKQFATCKSRSDVFKFKIKELKIKRDKEVENGNQNALNFINKKIELYTAYLSKML